MLLFCVFCIFVVCGTFSFFFFFCCYFGLLYLLSFSVFSVERSTSNLRAILWLNFKMYLYIVSHLLIMTSEQSVLVWCKSSSSFSYSGVAQQIILLHFTLSSTADVMSFKHMYYTNNFLFRRMLCFLSDNLCLQCCW